jgi:DNA-binding LytR/AlgR family response regulator
MRVLIVDDEPLALELLEYYVSKLPELTLAGKCTNALEAFSILNKEHVDAIFLDINMPEISGMDFLKMLKNPPAVIFTTAYTQYAAESYNLNAVDYLVKPITFERFVKAADKLLHLAAAHIPPTGNNEQDILFVPSEGKMVRVALTQLYIVEGYKNYIRLWCEGGKVVVHNTMKKFEDHLAAHHEFLRIHKSYIINTSFVAEIDGHSLKIKEQTLPIGNTYRDDVLRRFDRYKLL